MTPPSRRLDGNIFSDAPRSKDVKEIEALNKDRHKQMAVETMRLLRLAAELKTEMDNSAKSTYSTDAVHKAEQIEKLARSVRERMSASYMN